jgi:hypothetical protein
MSGADVGARTPARLDDQLSGWVLALARGVWFTLTGLVVTLNVLGIGPAVRGLSRICVSQPCVFPALTPAQAAEWTASGASLALYAALQVGWVAIGAFTFIGAGILIFLLRSRSRIALLVSLTMILFGGTIGRDVSSSLVSGGLSASSPWIIVPHVLKFLGNLVFTGICFLFPSGHWVPRWTRWVMLPCVAVNAYWESVPGSAFGRYSPAGLAWLALLTITMLAAQIYRYRSVSTPSERRQTRWVVMGFAIGLVGITLVISSNGLLLPPVNVQQPVSLLLVNFLTGFPTLFIPASFVIAMQRSHLFDIDTIIKRALLYGSLTAILGSLYLAGVIGIEQIARPLTGRQGEQPWMIVVSTLIIAAMVRPLQRRIQAVIDRRFYRAHYDATRTVERFAATLRSEVDLNELTSTLLTAVDDTMRPAHSSLWLRPRLTPRATREVTPQ